MIERKFKTTHGRLSVKIPSQLNEITLGQMIDLQKSTQLNDLDAISILSGTPIDELNTVINIDDFQQFAEAVLALSQQVSYLYDSGNIPKKVTLTLGKIDSTVNVIQNLSVEPAGAYMAASDIIAEEINTHIQQHGDDNWREIFNPSLSACCQVLAHYFYCRATGKKYNEYDAEDFCETIKKMRVTEALPIARHFFTCYPSLLKQRTGFWQQLLRYWKKRRAFNPSRSLNISIP